MLFRSTGFYDDNPKRESYSNHPLPDFGSRLDYGCLLNRYLDRFHYAQISYDAQFFAFSRNSRLDTVDQYFDGRWNWFDPQIDLTGQGSYFKPRAHVAVTRMPQEFIAGAIPRRMQTLLTLPAGYKFGQQTLEFAPSYMQDRYLDGRFSVLSNSTVGGYVEMEWETAPGRTAWYLRPEFRAIEYRRNDLFNNFSVTSVRLGWRQAAAGGLTSDLGIDFEWFNRGTHRSLDGTPRTQISVSPYVELFWQIEPDSSSLRLTLQRRYTPDVTTSATALTDLRLLFTQMLAKDLLDANLRSRLAISNRTDGTAATFFEARCTISFHADKADWPPLTILAEIGLDINQSDTSGSSYQARVASLGMRAVF